MSTFPAGNIADSRPNASLQIRVPRSVFLFLFLLPFMISGCKPGSPGVVAVYDAPKILVHHDEIVNIYRLHVGSGSQFSAVEVEEIFNMLRETRGSEGLYDIALNREGDGTILVTMGKYYAPGSTTGPMAILYFNHTAEGRFELLEERKVQR